MNPDHKYYISEFLWWANATPEQKYERDMCDWRRHLLNRESHYDQWGRFKGVRPMPKRKDYDL